MNSSGHGRWSLLGMTPMVLLLLGLHLQGSASRCIDTALGEDIQPLPPGVQRCSLPSGLLQPDVPQPGQGGGSSDGGGNRIVGGSPAGSGSYGSYGNSGSYGSYGNSGSSGSYGGGFGGVGPTPPMDGPYPPGGPNKLGPFGRPIWPIIAGGSSQSGGSQESGPLGGGPGGSAQYGGYPGQYGGGPYGNGRGYSRLGHLKPIAKPPGIPYIPTAREWGGGHIPVPRDSPPLIPNSSNMGQYGGAAGSYGGAAGSYGGGPGSYNPSSYSEPEGPRGREDGSYGPEPLGTAPGSQSNKEVDRELPCKPNNNPCQN